jgi:CheY-like chemotaxis protein
MLGFEAREPIMQPVPQSGVRILVVGQPADFNVPGCTVERASGGDEALARMTEPGAVFHLVLMGLPAGRYDALRRLRAWERANGRRRMPVVALTANASEDEIERAIQAGADGHLAVPVECRTLLDAVAWYRRGEEVAEVRVEVPEFLRDMAQPFLRRQRLGLFAAAEAIKGGDFAAAQTFAHNLKGCGRSYGFPLLTEMGRAMELAAKERNGEQLGRQVEDMRAYLTALEIA